MNKGELLVKIETAYRDIYPRKMGKSQGLKIARTQVKTEADLQLLKTAMLNYRRHITSEGTGKQYIMYFSTFMGQWRDWLDPDIGVVETDRKELDLAKLGFE